MKRVVRENIMAAYSLHDMNVIEFEVRGDDMIMKTQSGISGQRACPIRWTAMWSFITSTGTFATYIY